MTRTKRRTMKLIGIAVLAVAVGGAVAVAQSPSGFDAIFGDKENETSKQEIIDEDQTLIALGEEDPAPKPEDPEAARPETDPEDTPVWNEGIFKGGQDFPGGGYTFNTVWQGTVGARNVRVYAGSYADKEAIGLVLVDFIDPATWEHSFEGPFEAPLEGPLTIVDSKGSLLVLSASGDLMTNFDVETLEFR